MNANQTHNKTPRKKKLIRNSICFFFLLMLLQPLIPLVNIAELLLLLNIFRFRKRLLLSGHETWIMILLFLTGTAALIIHNDIEFISYWHYCIIMPILLYLNGKLLANERELVEITHYISIVCLIIISISIYLTPNFIEIKEDQWTDEHTRIFRLFFNHDILINGTGTIVYLIPSFCIFYMKSQNKVQKIIKLVSIVLMAYCIFKSESRSALVFIFTFILYYLAKTNANTKIRGIFLAIFSLLIISFFFDLSSLIPERFTYSFTQKTGLTSRDLIWASAISIISQNFFGVTSPFMNILGQTYSPHNNFLTYWILFGWMMGVGITYTFIAIEVAVISKAKRLSSYLPYIMSAILINFFFESPAIAVPFSFAFYALLTGYIMNKKNYQSSAIKHAPNN